MWHVLLAERSTLALLLTCVTVAQGVPQRLADLNPAFVPAGSSASAIHPSAGTAFLARATFRDGSELWRTDGTEAGTTLVADLFPGPESSSPRGFVTMGGVVYFRATTDRFNSALFVSDGTAPGTRLIAPLGHRDLGWDGIVTAGGLLFLGSREFTAREHRLWRSDGTEAGTFPLPLPDPACDLATPPVAFGREALFGLYHPAYGVELWASDGSPNGLRLVQDIVPGPAWGLEASVALGATAVVNGALLFANHDAANGLELWRTDGTAAGTYLLRDIYPGPGSGFLQWPAFTVHQGAVYFTGNDPVHGAGLWRSDGTTAGTSHVVGLNPGAIVSSPQDLWFFAPANAQLGLYRSDGTASGTTLVRVQPWNAQYPYLHLASAGGLVFFENPLPFGEVELWRTDGTTAGTLRLPGPSVRFRYLTQLVDAGGYVLLSGYLGSRGEELWRSDGTAAGTTVLGDYRHMEGAGPREFAWLGRALFFSADTPGHGRELWKSDGTTSGTVLVQEIAPGAESADPASLTVLGSNVFFAARSRDQGPYGLWRSDGTNPGTVLVTEQFSGQGLSELFGITNLRGVLVFAGRLDLFSPTLLYRSDGTAAGTRRIAVWTELSYVMTDPGPGFVAMDGVLYFPAQRNSTGWELWRSDGTDTGTWMVAETWPGPGGDIASLVALDGILYFAAATPGLGMELWRSDGTAAGTALVRDLRPGPDSSSPRSLTAIGGAVYFAADDGVHGRELWRSDGTAVGTVLVGDLVPGPENSNPMLLTALGDQLLFAAEQPATGFEPWRSNGTAAGTFLLRDLMPGMGSGLQVYHGSRFLALPGAGRALLTGSDLTVGSELWTTDGATLGASPHADIAPGPRSANPGGAHPLSLAPRTTTVMPYAAGRIWFEADDGTTGRELWSMESMAAAVPFGSDCAAAGRPAPELAGAGGAPVVGNRAFALRMRRAAPGAPAFLFLGVDPGFTPIAGTGCALLLHPTTLTEVRLGFTDGTGHALFSLPIPADASLQGTEAYAQALVVDSASARPVTGSHALAIAMRAR